MLDTALSVLRALKDVYTFVRNVHSNIKKTHGLLEQTDQQIRWALAKQTKLEQGLRFLDIGQESKEALVCFLQRVKEEQYEIEKEKRKQERRLKPIRGVVNEIAKRVVGTHKLTLALEYNIEVVLQTLRKVQPHLDLVRMPVLQFYLSCTYLALSDGRDDGEINECSAQRYDRNKLPQSRGIDETDGTGRRCNARSCITCVR